MPAEVVLARRRAEREELLGRARRWIDDLPDTLGVVAAVEAVAVGVWLRGNRSVLERTC